MRKNFGAKPFLFPQPVMIIGTYDGEGKANAMNAAWGGIVGAYDGLRLCGTGICQQRRKQDGEVQSDYL